MGVFDSSNEAPGRTDYNAENLNSLQCTVAEKITTTKKPKNYNFSKKDHFGRFFLIFSAMVHIKELRIFML